MKSTKLIVIVALLLLCGTAHAQFGKLIERATQKAVGGNKTEQPADTPANTPASTPFVAMTPQEVIAKCPALPPVAKLVNEINIRASDEEVGAFLAQLSNLRDNADKTVEAANKAVEAVKQEDADRVAKRFTGNTETELANMDEAQQEAMINNMLSSMGMGNMTLAQIQAMEGKSDDEIMAAMSKSGVTVGGLTMDEIKAMEGMTDAQKEAYMKQGDRQKRVDAFRNSQQTKNALKGQEEAAVLMKTMTEMNEIVGRWREFDAQLVKEREEVARQIAAIDDKYATQVAAVPRTKWYSGETGSGYTYTDAELKTKNNIIIKCRTEQFTLLRNHVIKMQGSIKNIMNATVPRYDELMKQHLTASGMTSTAKLTPSAGYDFAKNYLDATRSVTSLPGIEIFGVESKIVW